MGNNINLEGSVLGDIWLEGHKGGFKGLGEFRKSLCEIKFGDSSREKTK